MNKIIAEKVKELPRNEEPNLFRYLHYINQKQWEEILIQEAEEKLEALRTKAKLEEEEKIRIYRENLVADEAKIYNLVYQYYFGLKKEGE